MVNLCGPVRHPMMMENQVHSKLNILLTVTYQRTCVGCSLILAFPKV